MEGGEVALSGMIPDTDMEYQKIKSEKQLGLSLPKKIDRIVVIDVISRRKS